MYEAGKSPRQCWKQMKAFFTCPERFNYCNETKRAALAFKSDNESASPAFSHVSRNYSSSPCSKSLLLLTSLTPACSKACLINTPNSFVNPLKHRDATGFNSTVLCIFTTKCSCIYVSPVRSGD